MSKTVTTKPTGESFFLRGVTIIISGAATIYFGITASHFKKARDEGCDGVKNSESHSLYIFNFIFAIVFAIIFVYALFALFYDMNRNNKLSEDHTDHHHHHY